MVSLMSHLWVHANQLLIFNLKVTTSVTNIVSNIASVETAELEAAESSGAISQIVEAFEQQLSNAEVAEGEQLTIKEPNVAVQVHAILL